MFHFAILLLSIFSPGLALGNQAEVQIQAARLPARSAQEDAGHRIRELAKKMEEAVAIGFGGGQHGKRVPSSSDSSPEWSQLISWIC